VYTLFCASSHKNLSLPLPFVSPALRDSQDGDLSKAEALVNMMIS